MDVGSSAIRLCELTQTKAGYQLTKYFRREVLVDPQLDDDSKKKLRVDALKALLKEAKVRTRRTIFAVPGRSVFTRTRTLPPVPEHKLTQIVRYEIQQQIPFALDQIALDYQVLHHPEGGGYDVMMAAIKVDVVDKHVEILREAKCNIDAVDVCPLAAYNWLKHIGEFGNQGECVALIDLGATTTDIVIERGGQFRFTRPLNLAGNDITAAISAEFQLSFAEAEQRKRSHGFAPTGDPQRDGKVGEVIGGVLSRLVTEITRSFAYFRSLPGGGSVDRVIVTGGGACLRNIIPYLQRQFGVEVRIAQPTAGLAVAAAAQEVNEHPEQTSVALGMALRGLQPVQIAINLIPPEIIAAAKRREQLVYWMLSFITLGLIAASVIPANETKDRLVRNQIETLKQYIRQYDPVVAENPKTRSVFFDQLEAAKRAVKFREDQLAKLDEAYNASKFWLNDLKLINNLRPEGGKVWLSSIESSLITPGGGGPDSGPGQPPAGGRAGLSGGGGGPAGPAKSKVNSTGFGSLTSSGRTSVERPGGGQPGGQQAAAAAAAAASPLPRFNGYRIFGYAKDPDSLMQFIKQLQDNPRFKQGVYAEEANFTQVYISDMDYAYVPQGGGGQRPTAAPVTDGQWETVIFFQVNAQFGPTPGPQQRPGAPMPPAMAPPPPPPAPGGAPKAEGAAKAAEGGGLFKRNNAGGGDQ